MYTVFLIGIGGFIGAVLRYVIGGWIQNSFVSFPLGTLGVNVIGSFFLGLIMFLSEYQDFLSDEYRIFLTIGVIGSFTTLSTFSYESFRLLDDSNFSLFAINIASTVVLSLLAVYFGKTAAFIIKTHLLGGVV